jgi:hypothetical protein
MRSAPENRRFGQDLHQRGNVSAWPLLEEGRRMPDIGFFTAWPANVWLIRRGIKETM